MAKKPLYTPRLEYQCDGSTTHYQGCKCHETRWVARLFELQEKLGVAVEAIEKMLPIVEEAFWDHHTAGHLPGSGYNHRVYRRVSDAFGWRDSKVFTQWKDSLALIRRKQGGGAL